MTKINKNKEARKPIVAKVDLKFIRTIGKMAGKLTAGTTTAYLLPFMFSRNVEMPVGMYQVTELRDLPDNVLASFGLQRIQVPVPAEIVDQKIPANEE